MLLQLILYVFYLQVQIIGLSALDQKYLIDKRLNHKPIDIPDHDLGKLSMLSDGRHLKGAIAKILIPRIVGTKGHDEVRNFIVKSMRDLNWHVESDKFEDETPNMGKLTFENIIATLNPAAERFLVVACHYDSKYMEGQEFLGATDSAVPCAMMINTAFVLKDYLQKIKGNNDLSLKLVFFDGEEAFHEWSAADSIYGARHLAQKWEKENFLPRLDVLILLDLIGAPDPKFYSFFKNTEEYYARLCEAEERLAEINFLENYTTSGISKKRPNLYFQQRSANSFIEDDHIPFLDRDVPILHLIPVPFPEVWHEIDDNHEIIDYSTVENINKILRVFIAEYLRLEL